MESITKAAKAALRVASLVIQRCQVSSEPGVSVVEFDAEDLAVLSSRTLGGESNAGRPVRELPRLMRVKVESWWI
jgi:hypothetical protein